MTDTVTDTRDLSWLDEVENLDDRERLANLIPAVDKAEAYTHRNVADLTDFATFDSAMRLMHNIMLPGPSGSGKTTAARAYAAANGLPFVSVEVNGQMDFATVFGDLVQDPATKAWAWRDGDFTLVVRYGGVIMIDEVNFAAPKFTAALHGLLDARQTLTLPNLGAVRKSKRCLIVSAYNPLYTGVVNLNEAFLNRFTFTIPWKYDPAVEQERIGVYSKTLLALMRSLRAEDGIRTDVGTNWGEDFIEVAADASPQVAALMGTARFADTEQEIVRASIEAKLPQICRELGLPLTVDNLGGDRTAE
jgi:MoxR-like ATPase